MMMMPGPNRENQQMRTPATVQQRPASVPGKLAWQRGEPALPCVGRCLRKVRHNNAPRWRVYRPLWTAAAGKGRCAAVISRTTQQSTSLSWFPPPPRPLPRSPMMAFTPAFCAITAPK